MLRAPIATPSMIAPSGGKAAEATPLMAKVASLEIKLPAAAVVAVVATEAIIAPTPLPLAERKMEPRKGSMLLNVIRLFAISIRFDFE